MRVTCQNDGFHLYFAQHRLRRGTAGWGVESDMFYLFYIRYIPGARSCVSNIIASIARMYGGEHRYQCGVAITYDVYVTVQSNTLHYTTHGTEKDARDSTLTRVLLALQDPAVRESYASSAYSRVMDNLILTPACMDCSPLLP